MPSFIVEKSLNSVKTFWLEQEMWNREPSPVPNKLFGRNYDARWKFNKNKESDKKYFP